MDIGIITSFYNYYDRFLPQWIDSIKELTIKPSQITIVQSGIRYKQYNLDYAKKILTKLKINFKILKIKKHRGMGFARNFAVRNTFTKWIMYLDVDDIIRPKAIEYLKKYQYADIICGGLLVKWVDVPKAKIKRRRYLQISKERILNKKKCCSSHSVYKKSLWLKFKYPEKGIKSELCNGFIWIGFAKLEANFVGTKEIITVYLRRKDGHYWTSTKPNKHIWKNHRNNFIRKVKQQ
jgi:glycosyltransferase involved in cell wall biosynthesis